MYLINDLRAKEFYARAARLKYIAKQKTQEKLSFKAEESVHVVYLLGHVNICGGVKIIFEHANELMKHGVRTTLLSHFPKPSWFTIDGIYKQVPFGIELARGIPQDCDVIVATYWDQLGACVETNIAPVVYFEQGDFHLWNWENLAADKKELIQQLYKLPSYVITCSNTCSEKIKEIFNREAMVFPNALNDQIFFPRKGSPRNISILGVGSEHTSFKRIPDIWNAQQQLASEGIPVEFTWVTQTLPEHPLGTVIVNPSQPELGDIYRDASVYVCASEYESFCLPALEAMACGAPVIATANDGVRSYGVDGENCLFFELGNISELVDKIKTLLEDPALYTHLQHNGYLTAQKFKWSNIIIQLKNFYQEVAKKEPIPFFQTEDWVKLIPEEFNTEEQAAIDHFLERTIADLVYLPMRFRINSELVIIRWYPAFQRILANSNQVDYCCSFIKERPLDDYPYKSAVKEILTGNYEAAITQFQSYLDENKRPKETAVLTRWLIWCLIKVRQFSEAQTLLQKSHQTYPSYTDIYYLYSLLFHKDGNRPELQAIHSTIKFLGEALDFPEFIALSETFY